MSADETGWVIECVEDVTGRHCYWSGIRLWSYEHLDAVRFARKADAERVATHESIRSIASAKVTDHMWCAPHCICGQNDSDTKAWYPDGCPVHRKRIATAEAANAISVALGEGETVFVRGESDEACALCGKHVRNHFGGVEYRCNGR